MRAQTALGKLEKTAFFARELWSGDSVVTIGKRTTVGPRLPKLLAERFAEKLNAAITEIRTEIAAELPKPAAEQVTMELDGAR